MDEKRIRTIANWLGIFVPPGQVLEIRSIAVEGRKATSAIFGSTTEAAKHCLRMEEAKAKGIYFTPNPLRPEMLGSKLAANKADILKRSWLLIDIDPIRPADTSSTDDERLAAWRILERCIESLKAFDFREQVTCDSGNGFHLCYAIDLPNTEKAQALVKDFLKYLHEATKTEQFAAVVDAKTFDAPRIWKVPGLLTRKGEETEERPHRYSRLLTGQPATNEIAEANTRALERYVTCWRKIHERRGTYRAEQDPKAQIVSRAKLYLAREPEAVSGAGGSNTCFHVCCVLTQGFALDEETALDAIQDWNARCKPPWTEAELRHKLKDAAKAASEKPRGYLLGEQASSQPAQPATQAAGESVPASERGIESITKIKDLAERGSQVEWLWPGWIQNGVLCAIAGQGGSGKTRFVADVVRRIRNAEPWPDDAPMTAPQDARILWVMADNHHDEMVTLTRTFGIEESVWANSWNDDPYGGVSLDAVDDIAALDRRIEILKPHLVVIDTVGNSTDKNLSKQEDAKSFYAPLQGIARRHRCAILCVTHLNASDQFLGRRVLEKVRTAIKLSQPDENDDRRRLEIVKSNSKRPDAMGVTMKDGGNEYDRSPPSTQEAEKKPHGNTGRSAECKAWLISLLSDGPKKVGEVLGEGQSMKFSTTTIYQVKKEIGIEEAVLESRKWWRLPADFGEAA